MLVSIKLNYSKHYSVLISIAVSPSKHYWMISIC